MYIYHGTRNEYDKTQNYTKIVPISIFDFTNSLDFIYDYYFDIWIPPFLLVLCMYFVVHNFTNNKRKLENYIPIELNDRMKCYEQCSQLFDIIPHECPFLIRLDGRTFSNFTKKLLELEGETKEPYSKKFQACMIETAIALQNEFKCATAYTHSDEITLIFNKPNIDSEHLFGGRVSKLISLTASCASSAFLYNLMTFYGDKLDYSEPRMFDARIILFPPEKEYEIVNHMIWRSKGDCTRNFISMYSEKFLGKKQVQGMPNETRLKVLRELGHDLNSSTTNYALKHGAFIKYDKETKSQVCWVFKNISFSLDMYKFLTENHDYYLSDEQEQKLGVCRYELNTEGELIKIRNA